MKTAKQYILEKYLPTVGEEERELWYQCNEMVKHMVLLAQEYAKQEAVDFLDDIRDYNYEARGLSEEERTSEELYNIYFEHKNQ